MSKITKANEIKVPGTVIGLIFGQAGTGKSKCKKISDYKIEDCLRIKC